MPIAPDILSFCKVQNNDNESISLQDFAANMFHFLGQTGKNINYTERSSNYK